jgi:hypothetical protein
MAPGIDFATAHAYPDTWYVAYFQPRNLWISLQVSASSKLGMGWRLQKGQSNEIFQNDERNPRVGHGSSTFWRIFQLPILYDQ